MMLNGTWNWRIALFQPYTVYDKSLCKEAKRRNIDPIILTTEASTGMYSIRSEIMDTRDDSYSNLYIRNDPIVLKRREYEKLELMEFLNQNQ